MERGKGTKHQNNNNNCSGEQKGLENRISSYSAFGTQGQELRIPKTLRVVGTNLQKVLLPKIRFWGFILVSLNDLKSMKRGKNKQR